MVDLNERELYPRERRPQLGADDAPITVEILSEFGCPACAYFHTNELPQLRETYVADGMMKIIHGDYVFPREEFWSYAAASAALNVYAEHGDELFFEYTEQLMSIDSDNRSISAIIACAALLDIPIQTVKPAAENQPYKPVLEEIAAAARDHDLNRIPAIFVNDERIQPPSGENVRKAIESHITPQ